MLGPRCRTPRPAASGTHHQKPEYPRYSGPRKDGAVEQVHAQALLLAQQRTHRGREVCSRLELGCGQAPVLGCGVQQRPFGAGVEKLRLGRVVEKILLSSFLNVALMSPSSEASPSRETITFLRSSVRSTIAWYSANVRMALTPLVARLVLGGMESSLGTGGCTDWSATDRRIVLRATSVPRFRGSTCETGMNGRTREA